MAKAKKKQKKKKKINYYRQPEDLSLRDWQIALRKQYGENQEFTITNVGDHPVWSDFVVHNPKRNTSYRVAIRGKEVGDNSCECYDFKTSTLGTCKHIEWALHKLYHTYGNKQHFKKSIPDRSYSSVYLDYNSGRRIRLRIGTEQQEALSVLAKKYFDQEGILYEHAWLNFDQFLREARAIAPSFKCSEDALDFIIQKRADLSRQQLVERLQAKGDALNGLVQAQLYPYQQEGVFFALKAGRCLLADEMGLGKTIQAIAAAELYRRELAIQSVFIICPTSLKYQWRSEIQKFTDSTVHVIEGGLHKRIQQYADTAPFYKIITYNIIARDYSYINQVNPDLIILDEAQRIKNWDTKIARAIKKLESPYRLALTGTPLENKLQDIYSIVQFLDQFLLGPLWLLLARHQVKDGNGAVRGYQKLDQIHEKLRPIMIRRRKKDVIKQLPERVDQNLFVPMTGHQLELHNSYDADVAKLVAKWHKMGFLNEKDRQKLMISLNLMRMSCDSSFLLDQQTRHDTKIDELFYILEERLADPVEKVVVFSQWERMTRLVAQELEARDIPFAYLHGGVPSVKRGALLDRFREEEACRVFLSTDAGGVGLNLQRASLLVNLDLPWNPAVLEQRIGRVYRLGQERQVQVVNLISEGTIEHRMLSRLKFKSSLAEAVLDTAEEQVFMSDRKFRNFMEDIQRMQETQVPEASAEASTDDNLEQQTTPQPTPSTPPPPFVEEEEEAAAKEMPSPAVANAGGTTTAPNAEKLVSNGIQFFTQLTQTLSEPKATEQLLNQITEKDQNTGQTYLKIPIEDKAVVQNALKLFSGLLKGLQ